MILRPILIVCAWMLFATCNPSKENSDHALTATLSADASSYLSSALDTLKTHSINRDSVDWADLRTTAFEHAQGATTPEATYPAIKVALQLLGDGHSFFILPEEAAQWETNNVHQVPVPPTVEMLGAHRGYINLPGALVVNPDSVQQYVARLQRRLREVDAKNPCGWILDLRSNWGGNMWAMLAGIGPLLGEGQVGSARFADGREAPWLYTGSRVMMDTTVMVEINAPVQLRKVLWPIAVLTNKTTSSSGEAVAVAFRGRTTTRSFGQETGGVPTGNDMFKLSDGAAIALTTSLFADRTGRVYSGPIKPDTLVAGSEDGDVVMEAALAWLANQKSCQTPSQQTP